jgi:beta-aspartyl-peptidase (threonine type)
MSWALVVHGGAKEIAAEDEEANRAGCLKAVHAGCAVLKRSGSAVDAVEAALRVLEDDPTFNCGYGSDLRSNGEVEMCSAVMKGDSFDIGGVSVIQGVRHPISVAKAMLEEDTILVAGASARRFAAEKGLELCAPQDLIPVRANRAGTHDTVGCVALDARGLLVAGTSTGGLDDARPGRIGDSPMPGCGYYADNAVGAVAVSGDGDGEHIARKMLAARIMHGLAASSPDEAVQAALVQLSAIGGEAGAIVLSPSGKIGWMHSSKGFAVAHANSSHPDPKVFLKKAETLA